MDAQTPVSQDTPDCRKTKSNYYVTVETCYDPGQLQGEVENFARKDEAKIEAKYNYRPTALRVWFLLFVTAFLLGCVVIVEYALRNEPSGSQVYKNATVSKRHNGLNVPAKGWLGPGVGNNLAPDGMPRPRGMPRLDREGPHAGLVERVPFSGAYMPSGLTTRTAVASNKPHSQTTQVFTLETFTTESIVQVTITPTIEPAQPTQTAVISSEATSQPRAILTSVAAPTEEIVTITSVLGGSNLESTTIILPEVVSASTERTVGPDGHQTAITRTITVQPARTTVQTYEAPPAKGQGLTTTVITSTIGKGSPGPSTAWTTVVDETRAIPAVTTSVALTTTELSGNVITTWVETTLSAETIIAQVTSTLSDDQNDASKPNSGITAVATALGFETQRRFLGSSSASSPTLRVVGSTISFATVVSTTIPTLIPSPSGDNATELEVLGLTDAQYFSGAFLPTILAVVATGLLNAIATNAKLIQPFQALASSPAGVDAESSVFLQFDQWAGALAIPQAIRLGQPLIFLTQLIVLGSAVLAPLAAETVMIYTPSSCTASCYGKIAVQTPVARAMEGLLGVIAVLLVAVVAVTNWRKWRTGINHNPWSIAGMASLCLHHEVRELLARIPRGLDHAITEKDIAKVLSGKKFMLSDFPDPSRQGLLGIGGLNYGLVVVDDDSRGNQQSQLLHAAANETHRTQAAEDEERGEQTRLNKATYPDLSSWLLPLRWWFRAALICLVASVMAIVGYYQKSAGSSGFERFMDSRGFGVRFLFTALGVLLGGFMESFFECE